MLGVFFYIWKNVIKVLSFTRATLEYLTKSLMQEMEICKNCNIQILEEFCPKCGQQAKIKRINSHYISHELFHLFHLEKGFLFNIKELAVRPADSIREFITENRNKHMKPIGFLIFSALIYTFIYNYFKPEKIAEDSESYFHGSYVEVLRHWTTTHFGYTYIITSFIIAGWTRLFFKKYGYNIYEIMTLMCFVSGQGMLLIGLLLPFHSLLTQTLNNILLLSATMLYPTIVIGQFFDKSRVLCYIKAFIAFLLGNITFLFTVIAIGLSIDFIVKYI